MDGIIFCSNTGFSRRYGQSLSVKTGIPVFDLNDSQVLPNGAEVVFVGWLFGGFIQGLKAAKKMYTVRAVCAVGMSTPGGLTSEELKKKNSLADIPLFYLQGGFFMEKLHGFHKVILTFLKNTLGKSLLKKKNPTAADKESIKMFFEGADFFNEDNLSPVIAFLKA